jgi:hypothetical protein
MSLDRPDRGDADSYSAPVVPLHAYDETDVEPEETEDGLWRGDTGELLEESRRALVALLAGPYISSAKQGKLWAALLRDERAIRSRLSELFLDLVLDLESEVAYLRNVEAPDLAVPKVIRSKALTFFDTAILLHLRQELLNRAGHERVIIGKDEVAEHLQTYQREGKDETDFARRFGASWRNMEQYGIIRRTATDDRVEISPTVRLVFGVDQVRAIRAEYARLRAEGPSAPDGLDQEDDDDE